MEDAFPTFSQVPLFCPPCHQLRAPLERMRTTMARMLEQAAGLVEVEQRT